MNQDNRQHAIFALRVYKERGEAAVQHLADHGADEAFFQLMRRRDAAFANFRALDAVALKAGIDLAQDIEAKSLYRELQASHRLLEQLFGAAAASLRKEQCGLSRAQNALTGYHSGPNSKRQLRGQG